MGTFILSSAKTPQESSSFLFSVSWLLQESFAATVAWNMLSPMALFEGKEILTGSRNKHLWMGVGVWACYTEKKSNLINIDKLSWKLYHLLSQKDLWPWALRLLWVGMFSAFQFKLFFASANGSVTEIQRNIQKKSCLWMLSLTSACCLCILLSYSCL